MTTSPAAITADSIEAAEPMGIPVAEQRNPTGGRSGGQLRCSEEKERPRFAVWGGRMNLLEAGGTAAQATFQASSYRGMHTTQRRDSLMG